MNCKAHGAPGCIAASNGGGVFFDIWRCVLWPIEMGDTAGICLGNYD